MGNGMNKILPGLYIGSFRDAKDDAQMDRHHITHILSVHEHTKSFHPNRHYLCVLAADTPDQNLIQYFSVCNDFIHAARLRGGNVLIHCLAGMSRSVTIAIAYVMSVTELSWKDALKVVRANRSLANPNNGFRKQLQEFEELRLADERLRLKERYPSMALVPLDLEQTQIALALYASLLKDKDICEGKCVTPPCPSGICDQRLNAMRRSSSSSSARRVNQSPSKHRILPPVPPVAMTSSASSPSTSTAMRSASPQLQRRLSSYSLKGRPGSAGSGFKSYTGERSAGGSLPVSRAGSRTDLKDLPPGVMLIPALPSQSHRHLNNLKERTSAPVSPTTERAIIRRALSTCALEDSITLSNLR